MDGTQEKSRKRWTGEEDAALIDAWSKAEYLNDLASSGIVRDLTSLSARAGFLRRNGVQLKKLKRRPAYKPDFAALSMRAGANGAIPQAPVPLPSTKKPK